MRDNYDCLVIGAGPAGCTAACLLAEAGRSTLLVEREQVPRFHVGESLMPEAYWTLRRLGVVEKLNHSHFSRKVGVQFVDPSGNQSQPFFFRDHDDDVSVDTWHVERAEFDKLLFETAAEKGADCLDQTRVVDVHLEESRPHQITLRTADGATHRTTARAIVDASGQSSLIANRLKLREMNPRLKKAAIWGHFQQDAASSGQAEDPSRKQAASHQEGAFTTILHSEAKRAWFWHIPVAHDRVSVGLVSDNDYLLKNGRSIEDVFAEELARCPGLQERLQGYRLLGRLTVAKEFSYTCKQPAGPGWVLVGDALGFLDPIYSTGVFLALRSGELAADCLIEGFERDDLSAEQLGKWTPDYMRGVQLFRKLVDVFYTNQFSLARFLAEYPQHRRNLTDLLIGRAFYEGADRIFQDLDPALEAARTSCSAKV